MTVSENVLLPHVKLAIFDLDDTLTDRDTDWLWASWRGRKSLRGIGEMIRIFILMRRYTRVP